MSALNIIVASADGHRFYAALETAIASAALGRAARIFMQGEAVALLRAPIRFTGDKARMAAGQPDLVGMIDEASAIGVELLVCQTGLALSGVTMADLVPPIRAAGLVSFLADIDSGDRLIIY